MSALLATAGQLPPRWSSDLLEVTLLVLVAAGATTVATCRNPTRQVLLLSLYGLLLSLTFFALQAPDVALSEMTVGAVVLPMLLLLTLAKLKAQRR